jgi:hypothetical protein
VLFVVGTFGIFQGDDGDDENENSTLLLDVYQVTSQAADMTLLEEEAEETALTSCCHAHVAVLGTAQSTRSLPSSSIVKSKLLLTA